MTGGRDPFYTVIGYESKFTSHVYEKTWEQEETYEYRIA